MRYRTAAAVVISVVTVVSIVAIPLKVTVDGIMYIASAKSLFQNDFGTNYALFREPGYPIFLRTLHYLGDDGMFIVAAQGLCMGTASFIALYAVRRALGHDDVTIAQVIVTILLSLNPMFLIYSALVLQQALFTLQLALLVLGVVWAMHRPRRLSRPALLALVALNYLSAIWTSIGWLYLALVPVVLTVIVSYWPTVRGRFQQAATALRKLLVGSISVVAIMALFVLVYAVGLQVYSGWEAIKAPYLKNSSIPGAVIEPLSGVPNIPSAADMTLRMFALMHMGTVEPYIQENDLFLRQQMVPGWGISQYDTLYEREPFTSYAPGYFSLSNPSVAVHTLFAKASRASPLSYSATFVGFLLALGLSLIRRKWRLFLVLLVPLAFLAVYAASNSPIDRYGIPAYPWAGASVVVLLGWIGEWFVSIRLMKRLVNANRK
jgi:cbb3-type cytochrome oxidase subunit 3